MATWFAYAAAAFDIRFVSKFSVLKMEYQKNTPKILKAKDEETKNLSVCNVMKYNIYREFTSLNTPIKNHMNIQQTWAQNIYI